MINNLVILFCLMMMTGCAAAGHVKELKTLKALSKEQAEIDAFVEERNNKFALMQKAIQSDDIKQYSSRQHILDEFGPPVFSQIIQKDGDSMMKWVYREVTEHFNMDKVNLYFDELGVLKNWEIIEAKSAEE
ncbi:MAG: hypothetical protein H6755_04360 [Candidatus Omnitrophica bacterium]|nr:hypothetical protein [Candidatus Omnitrophota bacterium]MCB9747623.1 hypothetical protein [Candidatus Omnitrophota bacterium]